MRQNMKNPYFILVIAVLSISTSAILVKATSAPSGVIAFYRLLFTILLMTPFVLVSKTGEFKKINKKDWMYSIIAGIFLAFHFILWFESLNYTSIASSTVLVTLQPLFSFLGSYLFFKEKISNKTIFAGALAILGSIIISWGDFKISGTALWGDILALIACVLVTAYLLVGQSLRRRVSSITYTYVVYCMSTITLLAYVFIKGDALVPYPAEEWTFFILLAIVPTLLGHSLINWSLKWLSTNTISMAILFEPIGATLLAYIIFKETLYWSQLLGGSIIFFGLILYLIEERRKKRGIQEKLLDPV